MAEKPAGKVFICYRRGEDTAVAGRLREWLADEFGDADLFVETHDVAARADFARVIEERMPECGVLLAVISDTWLDAPDGLGGRLLDKPDDPVRIEITAALRHGKRVIPVLVNEALMPGPGTLPDPLKPLTFCNAARLSRKDLAASLEELLATLKAALAEADDIRSVLPETARWLEEETPRARSGYAKAWPSLAELHQVLEPAHQERSHDGNSGGGFRDHRGAIRGNTVARYGNAVPEPLFSPEPAEEQEEAASWRAFLNEFPDDIDVEAARRELHTLEQRAEAVSAADADDLSERSAWARATSSGSVEEIRAFLNEWPSGEYAAEAREWLEALELAAKAAWAAEARKLNERKVWERAAKSGSIAEIRAFLDDWPVGVHAAEARARLEALENGARAAWEAKTRKKGETQAWENAWRSGGIAEIKAFLAEWPESEFADEARARVRELRGPLVTRRSMLMGLGAGAAVVAGGGGTKLYLARTPRVSPHQAIEDQPERTVNDQPLRTLAGHRAWIHSVAFSPDGRTVLSGGGDNVLKLWDTASGAELNSFTGYADDIRSAAFSPDGRTILSGCGGTGNPLVLLDAATGKVLRTFTGHSDGVPAVAFSPDGRTAISGSWDKTLKLWDVAKGKELRTFTGHTGELLAATFSPDGRSVLSGSRDGTLRLWNVATGKQIRTFAGHTDWVTAAVFSRDGRTALSSSTDKTLRLWEVSTGIELLALPGHARDFSPVAFSTDGKAVLSGGYLTLKLWDIATGRELRTFTGHAGGVTSLAISADGRMAVSGSVDTTLKLWDMAATVAVSAQR